jgi:hypothetical protein
LCYDYDDDDRRAVTMVATTTPSTTEEEARALFAAACDELIAISHAAPLDLTDPDRAVFLDITLPLHDEFAPGGRYGGTPRARAIGERLNTLGGIDCMRAAWTVLHERRSADCRELECAWDGIGEWLG